MTDTITEEKTPETPENGETPETPETPEPSKSDKGPKAPNGDKPAKPLTAREKKVAEIRDLIERVPSVVIEGDDDALNALHEEAVKLIGQLRGKDVAAEKAKLRNEFDRAVAKAKKSKPVTGTISLATADYTTNADTVKRRDAAAKKTADALEIQGRLSTVAEAVALDMMYARVRILDKEGNPDWNAKSHQGKQLTKDYLTKVGEIVRTKKMNPTQAAKLLLDFEGSLSNKRRDAAVKYVRKLDNDPEEAKLWAKALEAHPDCPPSEAVFRFTGMPRLTRSEAVTAKKAVTSDGDGSTTTSTPRFFTNLQALTETVEKAEENAKNITGDAAMADAIAKLDALIGRMTAIRGSIKKK